MIQPTVTAITATGGREASFKLCEKYMAAQTRQPDEWIVVDDCRKKTPVRYNQTVIRPKPYWKQGGPQTLGRNMIAALKRVKTDFVVFIEDDDVYCPFHVEELTDHLTWGRKHELYLAGEAPTMYYHVVARAWHQCHNYNHASLCATGFNVKIMDQALKIFEGKEPYYDIPLFKALVDHAFLYETTYVIGMKGLPGRPGAGNSHNCQGGWGTPDPDWAKLTELVGPYAEEYKQYFQPEEGR